MMQFPQYLWILAVNGREVLIRRGNTSGEPIEKCDRKDRGNTFGHADVVGVMDTCPIWAARVYSSNHPWDWLNK